GSSLARIAEAEVSASMSRLAVEFTTGGADELTLAQWTVQSTALLPFVARALDMLNRLHMDAAIRRFAFTVAALHEGADTTRMAVGFADLCGFTAFSADLSGTELGRAISDFEAIAGEAASRHGGRVVKLIGDEAMLVASDSTRLLEIGFDLLDAVDAHAILPPVRAGCAVGDVLVRDGD